MKFGALPDNRWRPTGRLVGIMVATTLASIVIACGRQNDAQTTIDVFAASSLTDVFTELEALFEESHSDLDVRIAYAGSHVLRAQIERGAQADVFVSASPEHMDALVSGGWMQGAHVVAHNTLALILPSDNPAGLSSFDDLPEATRIVIGSPNVPIGRYARETLERRGPEFAAAVHAHVVSEESNARLVRIKVLLGDADAAIVYRSDAVRAGDASTGTEPVDGLMIIEVPAALNPPIAYYAAIADGPQRDGRSAEIGAANDWTAFLTSDAAAAVFERHGFYVPVER